MKFIHLYRSIMENALGLIEDVYIDGIGHVQAKTDTGNSAHNVIHGIIKSQRENQVTFQTINDKVITLPYHDIITIHIGEGEKTERPVVKLNIAINDKKYSDVPFSVSDRSENEYKILLGEKFIKANGGMVDVTKKD
jgi:hypothetical protein